MAYTNKSFCWHGCISTNTEAAIAFYPEVLGWDVQTVEMGGAPATMFAAGGIPRAHVMAPPMEGVPSNWTNYLRVADVDARTAAAAANGGAVVVPPMDIPPGRFSVVTSPSGAHLHLFHEADEATATDAPAGDGAFHWVELWSKDIDADLTWIKASLGLEVSEMPMPDGPYYILKNGEAMVGGAMTSKSAEAPSMWLAWVQVPDVDATVARVSANGGKVHAPIMDVPQVGRMSVVADPTGGVFGVITPAG